MCDQATATSESSLLWRSDQLPVLMFRSEKTMMEAAITASKGQPAVVRKPDSPSCECHTPKRSDVNSSLDVSRP